MKYSNPDTMTQLDKQSRWLSLILFLLLLDYGAISFFYDFFHNHETDWTFHEYCPACQWQVQSQDDHSGLYEFLASLSHNDVLFQHLALKIQSVNPHQFIHSTESSRAPPFSL